MKLTPIKQMILILGSLLLLAICIGFCQERKIEELNQELYSAKRYIQFIEKGE